MFRVVVLFKNDLEHHLLALASCHLYIQATRRLLHAQTLKVVVNRLAILGSSGLVARQNIVEDALDSGIDGIVREVQVVVMSVQIVLGVIGNRSRCLGIYISYGSNWNEPSSSFGE